MLQIASQMASRVYEIEATEQTQKTQELQDNLLIQPPSAYSAASRQIATA